MSVRTSAGRSAVLHTYVDGVMTAVASGAVVPAHGGLVLSTGKGHLMIENLRGALRPGDRVRIDLTFSAVGAIHVTAPVIALGAPAPTSTNGANK
jgi:copper(I)-binding protein